MRTILMCLSMLVAAPAGAEWVEFANSDNVTFYFDPTTVRRGGDFVNVWTLDSFKQRGNNGALSKRALQEHDCKGERYRVLSWSWHTGPTADGEVLTLDNARSDSSYRLHKLLCK